MDDRGLEGNAFSVQEWYKDYPHNLPYRIVVKIEVGERADLLDIFRTYQIENPRQHFSTSGWGLSTAIDEYRGIFNMLVLYVTITSPITTKFEIGFIIPDDNELILELVKTDRLAVLFSSQNNIPPLSIPQPSAELKNFLEENPHLIKQDIV